jgi:TonB family protein
MKVTLRADPAGLHKAMSLICSVGLHGAVLAWVIWAPVAENRTPLLDREIRPNATRIVWYSLKQPLPAISPTQHTSRTAAPRALTRSPQTLVAGKQDLLRLPQLIWTPAPPLAKPKLLPSPNIVALNPPARPKLRSFVPPPPETRAKASAVIVPAAPELTVAAAKRTAPSTLLPPLAHARKTFIPPVEALHQPTPSPISLPAAPTLAEVPPAKPLLTTVMAKPLKNFTPPPEPTPAITAPLAIAEAPQVSTANRPAEATLAIVGLFPKRNPDIPAPKVSQQAGFSAGPRPQPVGGDDAPQQSQLVVPGLLARSGTADGPTLLSSVLGPPTSLHNLMAAARAASITEPEPNGVSPAALRVATPPDPRLVGRIVYSIALQMPNVTSYSGSWVVWFAERDPDAHSPARVPGIQPPAPVHKVDPKYVPAAVAERVEGKVRLAAVIRKDGSVDTVEVLRSLDERLDRSAREALTQWKFEPARRDGRAIDVDAVFEIPFQLAPRVTR